MSHVEVGSTGLWMADVAFSGRMSVNPTEQGFVEIIEVWGEQSLGRARETQDELSWLPNAYLGEHDVVFGCSCSCHCLKQMAGTTSTRLGCTQTAGAQRVRVFQRYGPSHARLS